MNTIATVEQQHAVACYQGRRVVLLTQHGKEALLRPVMQHALGCHLERVDGYDTDQLGTFTREIPRHGTQLETARRKAHIGMELADCPLGMASEGAFGPDPFFGMSPWNTELVIFIDTELKLEVVGVAYGRALHRHRYISDLNALREFAQEAGFPEHHLVIRPDSDSDPHIEKGIADWDTLETAFEHALALAVNRTVFVENDLRAHCNPTRQDMIRKAADNLIERLRSLCPRCDMPGFWIGRNIKGLPCRQCGAPTHEALADLWSCDYCEYREDRPRNSEYADPARCDICNP